MPGCVTIPKVALFFRHGGKNRFRVLGISALILFLVSSPIAIMVIRTSDATSNGFNISTQSSLSIGEPVNLQGTICPNPDNTFEFVVVVNYTNPSAQVTTKTEQIGYGQVSLCSSSFTIDSQTIFNSTGSWRVEAQAKWIDSQDVQHTLDSNIFSFAVSQQSSTSTVLTSTSSSNAVGNSSLTFTESSSTGTTSSQTTPLSLPSSTSSYVDNVSLGSGGMAGVSINITEPSYLGYFAISYSSTSIQEALLSPDEYSTVSQYGGDLASNSFSYSQAEPVLNGLLVLPGTYYLVVYSPSAPAQVYYGYNASLALQVQNATTYVGAFINLSEDSHSDFMVHDLTIGSPSEMQLFGISTEPVNYQIVSLLTSQSVIFSSPDLTTTNLNGTMPSASVQPFYDLSLPPGLYQLTISNSGSTQSEVYFEYQLTPAYVNPYKNIIEGKIGLIQYSSAPMGVVSYGIDNNSGTITPYSHPIMTPSLIGATYIGSLSTNITQTSFEDASNQLNGVLVVANNDGSKDVYWAQNVPAFVTSSSKIELDDDVLNITGDYATLTSSSITSPYNNIVNSGYFGIQNNPQYYMNSGLQSYTLPLQYSTVMTEGLLQGTGVEINMTVDFLKGVSHLGTVTFDQITIHDPNAQGAYFYVSGSDYTPGGLLSNKMYYDAENIFGGGGGGAEGYFTSFNAKVTIGYYNSGTQNYTIFPSAYTFGADTGETAANLHASYEGNGVVGLSAGNNENWAYAYPSSSMPSSQSAIIPTALPMPEIEMLAIAFIAISAGVALFFVRKKRTILSSGSG